MSAPPTRRRLIALRALLALAVAYFLAGGVLALWFAPDGLDLYVSYVAGTSSVNGASPYERDAYLRAWDSLAAPPTLATSRDLPFAYPPSWIPVCVALSLLPWGVALATWKLLNVLFLVGVLWSTFRLLRERGLTVEDRYVVGGLALTLSPTLSAMTVGQTSIFVLFMLLATGLALREGRPLLAGLALACALLKPQLAAPLVLFLLVRREIPTLATAAVFVVILTGLGLHLSHADLGTYLAALGAYTESNAPTSHIAVGIASVLAHLTALDTRSVTAIGLAVGLALVGGLAFRSRGTDTARAMPDALPLLLYIAPLGFRCHAYDLVALIPLFAWSRTDGATPFLRWAPQTLIVALVVPRAALRLIYEAVAVDYVSASVYRVTELGFRSWILVLLLPLVALALRARTRSGAGSPPSDCSARPAAAYGCRVPLATDTREA